MTNDPVPPAIELNARARDQSLVDPAQFAGPEGSGIRSLGFDDVLSEMELSWVATSSASLLVSLGRGPELEKSLKNTVKKRMAVLRAGLHARKALTKDRSTLRSRGIKQLLESSAALRDRAWLTSSNTDFEVAESALTDALAAAGRPPLRLQCLAALSRCYELHGIALGDMTNWELSAIMAHRAIELAMGSDDTAPHDRAALEDAIEATLTWAAKDIAAAEILPPMRHKLMAQAASPLGLARSLLNYDPGARLTLRRMALSSTRYGALERRYLMLESRAALQRYLMTHDVEGLLSAIEYAGSARALSDPSRGDDWGDSSLLVARYLCWLAGTGLDEQELSAVVSSGRHALGDALLSATLAGPSHLESLELCASIFASGDDSSRSVARLVREQGCLGSALKSQQQVRYRMTRDWAEEEVERGNWPLAAQLYDVALAALEDLTASDWEGHRELWLASGSRLQASAAHAHAVIGEPLRALEIADAARLSILTSSSADWLAPELARLAEQGHGDLAAAMNKADIAFAKASEQGVLLRVSTPDVSADELEKNIHSLRRERKHRQDVIRAIRQLEGFAEFPSTLEGASIRRCAEDGPLIYLVPGQVGGSLLMVAPDGSTVSRELPALSIAAVTDQAVRYTRAYDSHLDSSGEDAEAAYQAWADQLEDVTGWLWHAAAEQMLEALDGKPFARLVAMGPLALMPPIHAAWVEDTGGNRRYVHDDVALSYLPSAAALLRARMRGTPATSAANRLRPLIINAPANQEAGPLAWSDQETASLRERLPWTAELSDEAATRDAFRDALPRYNLIHVSAHGYAVGDQPRRSGFLLAHGDHVTVTDLRAWNTESLELLVLSSCDSAATGGMIPDQMISLPGAVFASSGCQVVGTLWEAEQDVAAVFFEALYRRWSLSTRTADVAAALRGATLETRAAVDSDGYSFEHPVLWAPFMLAG